MVSKQLNRQVGAGLNSMCFLKMNQFWIRLFLVFIYLFFIQHLRNISIIITHEALGEGGGSYLEESYGCSKLEYARWNFW